MSEEELLNYMSFTDDKVIFDKQFYQDVMLSCFNNSIKYKIIIKQLHQENKQLKEKLIDYLKEQIVSLNKEIDKLEISMRDTDFKVGQRYAYNDILSKLVDFDQIEKSEG